MAGLWRSVRRRVGPLRVWSRNFESWKDYATPSLVGTVAEPLLTFVAIGYGLGRFVEPIDGQPYVAFLAPGILAATAMTRGLGVPSGP